MNKNQVGVHLTLFWPTEISDENSAKLAKLTDEERKFITQNPALLEFILNQKKISGDDQPNVEVSTLTIGGSSPILKCPIFSDSTLLV